jgi:hypothetical protein
MANDMLERALDLLNISNNKPGATREKLFGKHFGSSPSTLTDQWFDLQTNQIPEAQLKEGEKSAKGLRRFLIAHYFIWTYPKNAEQTASRFSITEKYCRGKDLWDWIQRIGALTAIKIQWPDYLDDPASEIFILSVDGTDFKMWEPKHATLSYDPGMYSHKFNKAAAKYEIAVCIRESRIAWFSGPHRGARHDMTIFRDGLKQKIAKQA